MLKKYMFLNVCGEKIKELQVHKEKDNKKYIRESFIKDLISLKDKIKNKKIYIIVEKEEINIKYMDFPKVKREKLECMLQNELYFLYRSKAKEIYYDYKIHKEDKNDINISVACVICKGLNTVISSINQSSKVKKITLIQICFINYFKNYIKVSNYIVIFKCDKTVYFVAMSKEKIIANKVVKECSENYDSLKKAYDFIKNKVISLEIKVEKIYGANFENSEFEEEIIKKYGAVYTNLGYASYHDIIKNFIKNRGSV